MHFNRSFVREGVGSLKRGPGANRVPEKRGASGQQNEELIHLAETRERL